MTAHLPLGRPYKTTSKPTHECRDCKALLRKVERPDGQSFWYLSDGRRHYRTRCPPQAKVAEESHHERKTKPQEDEPCEVAIKGGYDEGTHSGLLYCDAGHKHKPEDVRRWRDDARQAANPGQAGPIVDGSVVPGMGDCPHGCPGHVRCSQCPVDASPTDALSNADDVRKTKLQPDSKEGQRA